MLLIVGRNGTHVIELTRQALTQLAGEKLLRIVPGVGHLFEEPGKLESVAELACAWFEHSLSQPLRAGSAPAKAIEASPRSLVAVLRWTVQALPT